MSDISPPLVLGQSSGCKRGTPGSSSCGPSQALVENPAAAAKKSQPPSSGISDSPTAASAVLLPPVANEVMRSEAPTHIKRRRQLDFPDNIVYTSDKDKGLEDEELLKMNQYSFRAIVDTSFLNPPKRARTSVQRQNTELRESCYYWQAHMPLVRDAFGKIIHSEVVGFGDARTGGGMLPRILLPKDLENLSKQDDDDLAMTSMQGCYESAARVWAMSKLIQKLKAQVKEFENDSADREIELVQAQMSSKLFKDVWRWEREKAEETREKLRKADELLTEHQRCLAEPCRRCSEEMKYRRKLQAKKKAYERLLECFRRSQSELERANAQIGILHAELLKHKDRWADLRTWWDAKLRQFGHRHKDEITGNSVSGAPTEEGRPFSSIDVDPNSLPTRSDFPDSTSPMRIE